MAKLTLTDVTSGFQSTTAVNANNALIETALENTLSRDGTSPNTMGASLDMNSHSILNLPEPLTANEPARLVDVQAGIAGGSANLISVTPAGGIASTNVQAALQELDSEKLAASGVSAFMATVLDDTTAAAARTTLGAGTGSGDATQSGIQAQTYTAFTTAGTSSAFTVTASPALTSYTNARLALTLNATPTGSPTMNWNGLGAVNWKYYDSSGTKQFVTSAQAVSGQVCDCWHDGTDIILLNPLASSGTQVQPISASVAASALTISASALSLDFRSATIGSGTVSHVSGTPANLVISSGSTLGTTSAVQSRLVVLALNNAGTIELAVSNISGGVDLTETGVISTTAEGGAGAADSATVVYSTTARTNVAYRVIGYIESTQATAGTWATAPSTIQGAGGQALAAMSSLGYGQTLQAGLSRTSGTTYYNTSGKPITVLASVAWSNSNGYSFTVNGNTTAIPASNVSQTSYALVSFPVPAGQSYSVTAIAGISTWAEIR